ncbi:MAG: type II toxin-antitoxin system HicB family antitoxin [Gammaproteobacteria bacterium]|nr:MAG: type II toxin-antitoxin system HicB family antitoxin [Gammaproteobacteria bacterium]
MQYTVLLEKGESSYGAFVPDIPDCIAVGETQEEALKLIKEGIEFHLEGLLADDLSIPKKHCEFKEVAVNIA